MADIFLYADESGNLDYNATQASGGSLFFGFGSAVFDRDHGSELWRGMRLRAELSGIGGGQRGLDLRAGFHAKNDTYATRNKVYAEIQAQAPRFDFTFMKKKHAFPYVRARGDMWLYKYTFYVHLKRVAPLVATPQDTLYVMVARLGTAARQRQAQAALEDVCQQTGLDVRLCIWSAETSWGLQVADYGSWAFQRAVERGDTTWYDTYIEPTTSTAQYPWGRSVP
jgi:hypothetical protein